MGNAYKSTMNLPRTTFPMRAGLAQSEPKRLKAWADSNIYQRVLDKNRDNEPFILHDGPPYANGPIHIGHAFNKILKDLILRYRSQRGFYTPYVPGWDCHGQPIEHMVEEMLGKEKMAKIDQVTLRRLCREWADRYIDVQRAGFMRLGVRGEWYNPYLTYLPEYEAGNVKVFKKMYLDGQIYRGRKPVHWCSHCHTAESEAEIEYSDEISPSLYVAFDMVDADRPAPFADALAADVAAGAQTPTPLRLAIWTTTPWTLPANTAVSLKPDAAYVVVRAAGQALIMAEDLVEQVAEAVGWDDYAVLLGSDGEPVRMTGNDLLGVRYHLPIFPEETGRIIVGDHVTLDTGTGGVHTAPGHGLDDYVVAQRFDVPTKMPVDDDGVFTSEGGPWAGQDAVASNPAIISWLDEHGLLLAAGQISHSYPHCWRCHQPVIFRATDQWFVSMDGKGLRTMALDAIDNQVTWYPTRSRNRIEAMVSERPDWCISRQRSWGVPIPVFHCEDCSGLVATEDSFDAVIHLFATEGADAWFSKVPSEYLPASVVCPTCGGRHLTPDHDILDVWWESGVSHTSVLEARDYLRRPADLYLEGSDQHRGWFQSSLLTSVGVYGIPPYKAVVSCGFTVDEQGRKMSKSLGNGIDPAEVTERFGADVLRLWAFSIDHSQDVSVSDGILSHTADVYRRIRNTYRFLLGNLYDFDMAVDAVSWEEMGEFDRWALARVKQLAKQVTDEYEAYNFHTAYRDIVDYVVGDLSAVYLDALKDRLYSEGPSSHIRRSAQTVLANVLDVLVRVLAPVLVFTTDEVWGSMPSSMKPAEVDSVQLAGWPVASDFVPHVDPSAGADVLARYATVLSVRESVTKALEKARNDGRIGKSQEARIVIMAGKDVARVLGSCGHEALSEILIVNDIAIEAVDDLTETQVRVERAEGEVCPRCWNIRTLGKNSHHPGLCERCAAVMDELGVTDPA